jgi:hypothetical protein
MTYDAICIPTYGRGNTIGTDTLNTLATMGTDMSKVHVYIGSDMTEYADAMDFHNTVNWGPAPKGYGPAQNHIRTQHPAGARIIIMDDDVLAIRRLTTDGKHLEDIDAQGWDTLTTEAFQTLQTERITLWGLTTTTNPFYMSDAWKVGLYMVHGPTFGYINTPAIPGLREASKQDWETTANHFTHAGAVLRINNHAIVTKPMRTNPGGQVTAQAESRLAQEREASRNLLNRFPALLRNKSNGASPEDDLRFVPNRRTK